MEAAHVRHDRAADHDVMEMGDDEIGVVDVHVDAQRGEEQAGQSADGEEADESQGIEHRRVERDRAFVKRGGPVEDLDGGRNRHEEAEHGKDHAAVDGDAGDEHVMRPDQESEDRDRQAGHGDEGVAEDLLAGESR